MAKKLLVGAALAAALIGAAPSASADVFYPSGSKGDQNAAAFLSDITPDIGNGGTPSSAESLAMSVCLQLDSGVSEAALIAVLQKPPDPMSVNGAKAVVWSAEWHYCPRHY